MSKEIHVKLPDDLFEMFETVRHISGMSTSQLSVIFQLLRCMIEVSLFERGYMTAKHDLTKANKEIEELKKKLKAMEEL